MSISVGCLMLESAHILKQGSALFLSHAVCRAMFSQMTRATMLSLANLTHVMVIIAVAIVTTMSHTHMISIMGLQPRCMAKSTAIRFSDKHRETR